jgi:hypothetical protein
MNAYMGVGDAAPSFLTSPAIRNLGAGWGASGRLYDPDTLTPKKKKLGLL